MYLNDDVTILKGIGPKKEAALNKIGIHTIKDFLYYFPKNYEDRREVRPIISLQEEETVLIRGKITAARTYTFGKKQTMKLIVGDNTGKIEVIFFHRAYLGKTFLKDRTYEFYGKVTSWANRLQIVQPDFNLWEEDNSPEILPVYPLTKEITQGNMRKWQKEVRVCIPELVDFIPTEIIYRNRLCSLQYAIENIHFPKEYQKIKEAKFRLIFDELFLLQIGLLYIKMRFNQIPNGISFSKNVTIENFITQLPFKLTGAQKRVINEIDKDMESNKVMNRLIQGDVGSGKTIVAASAIYKAVKSGYQAIMMAPTELLAQQHANGLREIFKPLGANVELLTGSLNLKKRHQVLANVKDGKTHLLVGTHAVIQSDVELNRLGLVITDEQHRFGVNQRELLSQKGENPDILVMTATPIPRTLAMILYGDLDLSIIDEMPPGRRAIITKVIEYNRRDSAYELVRKEVKEGHQAYIVAPLIEESAVLDVKSAINLYEELSKKFNNFNVKLLHGAMKQSEKDCIMKAFYMGTIDILVSTVIIEVGINVPNATIMLIENAERFGLATLHQLRGRIGRGKHQSYCILITEGKTELSKERVKILENSNDGFYIAEKDLELRGPGEFFGVRQHGIPELRIADLSKHIHILEMVRNEANNLLEKDPFLLQKKHQHLKKQIKKNFNNIDNISL
ncbi:MAG: ATP-dependent DNA helicase RecG [Anaerovoracaceae bacterium]